jgi:kumamolisin
MIRTSMRALAAVVAAGLIAGCGGGGGGGSATSLGGVVPQAPTAQSPSAIGTSTFMWGSQTVKQLSYVGPAQGSALTLAVQVQMNDAQGLVNYAEAASNPASSSYRHWLTPAEIAQRYGASTSNYASVANYFAGYGLKVGGWPQREVLTVSGTTAQFSQAFGTTFGVYKYLGKNIIAPSGTPRFAKTLPVVSAIGLMSAPAVRTYFIHGNNASFFGYSPQQIATGFDYSGAFGAGLTGTGINVGIIGTGPILNANGGDDDTTALAKFWNAPMAAVTQIAVQPQPATTANGQTGTAATGSNAGAFEPPPPVTAPCNMPAFPTPNNFQTCNPEDGEAQLDTESVGGLAPGANLLFYLGFNANEGCVNQTTGGVTTATGLTCPSGSLPFPQEGISISDDEIQQAIADNRADSLSLSFGEPENLALALGYITASGAPGLGQIEYASLAAEGIAVFVSSGDDGAWECFDPNTGNPLGIACVSYPASDPNVVAVGGVNIPLDESGNLTQEMSAWADNTTQGGSGQFVNDVGSGGGVSSAIPAPAWQKATLGASMREIPDMSLDADPDTGPAVVANIFGTTPVAVGGTSASAPEANAQWGLVLQACKASATCNQGGPTGYRLGNPAPLLYAIFATSQFSVSPFAPAGFRPHLSYAFVFQQILYGDNQAVPAPTPPGAAPIPTPNGYAAGPGYNQVTGLGAPYTGHLIQAITGTQVP